MRDNKLFENISKLNTFVHMLKSNELLKIYIEKITNNRSKNLKFVNDFDYIALDLLYTSLQIMNSTDTIKVEEYEKLDKRELKYYLDKTKGINFFKNQVHSLKDCNILISYLMKSLANGSYICNNNSTVKFDNGLIVDSDWIVEFSRFLVTSFNNNINLSNDSTHYTLTSVEFPERKKFADEKIYMKEIKIYEYSVKRKDNKKLSYDNVKYVINILSTIKEYNFKKLQEINSKLSNDGFALSINKRKPIFNKDEKKQIERLYNEDGYEKVLQEYIKDTLKCYDSSSSIKRRQLINTYELLLDLSRAYKCNYTLEECRKLFNLKEHEDDIECAFAIANFYINFIYDEENLNKYFNYSVLDLDLLKPEVIDYETKEYKDIIKKLSSLNKKSVLINRKINQYLSEAKKINPENKTKVNENNSSLNRNCHELEKIINEIKQLRAELDEEKDENHKDSNINRTKLKYIKEAIVSGNYYYDEETSLITFNVYSKKDYHRSFCLEISLANFNSIVLSEFNRNIRINFYQI